MRVPEASAARESASRLAGLDSIRLAAAVTVAMSHGLAIPPQIYVDQGTRLEFWAGQIGHALASGTGAVALFFVVSGLCIHLGRRVAESNPLLFLVRRMVRIGLPLVSILLVVRFLGGAAVDLEKGVLWSVYCELLYYCAYPLLLRVRRRVGLERILYSSLVLSAALLILLPAHPLIWQYGYWTPLICYPLWIAGALLAERVPTIAARRSDDVWAWRLGLVLAAAACSAIRHLPFASGMSALTYGVVGILAVPYLSREIAHARAVAPSRRLEKLGAASYSIYLVHRLAIDFADRTFAGAPRSAIAGAEILLVFACSFAFFRLCERPARDLARAISFNPPQAKFIRSLFPMNESS